MENEVSLPKDKHCSTFEEVLQKDGTLIFTNKGVSMMPLLRQDRDLMVIQSKDPNVRCKNLDAVLFRRDNGQYVLHRILQVRTKDYWIVGDNCLSGEIIREDQILGILTAVNRDKKTISVEDKGYRLYVKYWCAPYHFRFFILRCLHFARRCASYVKRHGGSFIKRYILHR